MRADLRSIVYTSGTTADPKGAQHSHDSVLAELRDGPTPPLGVPGTVNLQPFPAGHTGRAGSALRTGDPRLPDDPARHLGRRGLRTADRTAPRHRDGGHPVPDLIDARRRGRQRHRHLVAPARDHRRGRGAALAGGASRSARLARGPMLWRDRTAVDHGVRVLGPTRQAGRHGRQAARVESDPDRRRRRQTSSRSARRVRSSRRARSSSSPTPTRA